MRALDPIERSLTNKFIAAGALTFLTFEALYLFYLYVSCLRTVHRLSALRSGAATLGAILVAQVVIPPIQRFSVLGCEWVKPLCEFLK